ncbi:MAG: CinA family protein, partial [Bacteriovoracaceae bacterium]|nr:CinA family protein [Bacteriovoracaceae bacterium]
NILGVKQQTLKKFGAVSEETVNEMATGVLDKMGADLAVAFSGIAGPSGGSEIKPVGTLALASGKKKDIKTDLYHFAGDRERLKLRFSEVGLFKLLQLIRNY